MMKRSTVLVAIYTLITAGLYELYWLVKTKREMVEEGAVIPTSWLLIVPFANIYWMWKWAEGVAHVTHRQSALTIFLLLVVPGVVFPVVGPPLSAALLQSMLNDAVDLATPEVSLPEARAL